MSVRLDTLNIEAETSFGSVVNRIIDSFQSMLPFRRATDILLESAAKRHFMPTAFADPVLPDSYRITGLEADITITLDDNANLLTRKTRTQGQQYELKARMVDGDFPRVVLTWKMADFLLDGKTFKRILRAFKAPNFVKEFFDSTGARRSGQHRLKLGSGKFMRFTEQDFGLFFKSVGSPGSALIARIKRNFESDTDSKYDRDVLMITGFLAGVAIKLFYVVDFKIGDKFKMKPPFLIAHQISGANWVRNGDVDKDVTRDLVNFFQRLFRILHSTRKFVH